MEGEPEIGRGTEVANVAPVLDQMDMTFWCNVSEYSPVTFTTARKWKNICLEHYERLVEQSPIMGTEYVVFCGVTKEGLTKIDRFRGMPFRLMYDSETESLIIKIMVGKAHDWVAGLFSDILRQKILSKCGDFRALSDMRTFRCRSESGREKEPDVALVPRNRNRVEDWPSLVIEVGVAESLNALRRDAFFWIFHSNEATRVVLVIAVDVTARTITIERWGNEPLIIPARVPLIRPRKLQSLTIDVNGVVGAPLLVPSELIFDSGHVPQGVLGSDFTFDANELTSFFVEFWGMLN